MLSIFRRKHVDHVAISYCGLEQSHNVSLVLECGTLTLAHIGAGEAPSIQSELGRSIGTLASYRQFDKPAPLHNAPSGCRRVPLDTNSLGLVAGIIEKLIRLRAVAVLLLLLSLASTASAQVIVYGGWRRGVLDLPASDRPPHFAIFPPRPLINNAVTYNPNYREPAASPGPLVIDNPFFKGPKPVYKHAR